jgi:CBS domain-containing protein
LDANIKEIMAVMTRSRIRHLPVVEDSRLVGIVSIGDVVKNRLEEVELEADVLRDAYIASH